MFHSFTLTKKQKRLTFPGIICYALSHDMVSFITTMTSRNRALEKLCQIRIHMALEVVGDSVPALVPFKRCDWVKVLRNFNFKVKSKPFFYIRFFRYFFLENKLLPWTEHMKGRIPSSLLRWYSNISPLLNFFPQ